MSQEPPLEISPTGRLARGSVFFDLNARHPPASIALCHPAAPDTAPLLSWSAFPSPAGLRRGASLGGEHIALSFPHSHSTERPFLSVGVLRGDTWALQWGVRADASLELTGVCCVTSALVALLASGPGGGLFLAHRSDVPRRANGAWRAFLVPPRRLTAAVGLEGEELRAVCAESDAALLVLTGRGQLVRVHLQQPPARRRGGAAEGEACVQKVETVVAAGGIPLAPPVASAKAREQTAPVGGDAVSAPVRLVVCADGQSRHAAAPCALLFQPGGTSFALIHLCTGGVCVRGVPDGTVLARVEFAGPHAVVATFQRATTEWGMQFTCLLPPDGPDGAMGTLPLEPIFLPPHRTPLGTWYNAAQCTHTVLLRTPHAQAEGTEGVRGWRHVECAELPMHEGPYMATVLREAVWCPLVSAALHAPHIQTPEVEESEKRETHQMGCEEETQTAQARCGAAIFSQQDVETVQLHYVLATRDPSHPKPAEEEANEGVEREVRCVIFALDVAPRLHERLSRQWHNASAGLAAVLRGGFPVLLRWHPRHLRHALRRGGPSALRPLLALCADTLRAPMGMAHAAAAATIAVHIASIASSVGATLDVADVAVVAQLLRASRQAGHTIAMAAARWDLFVPSDTSPSGGRRRERYGTTAWTTTLQERHGRHAEILTETAKLLAEVRPIQQQQLQLQEERERQTLGRIGGEMNLADWMEWGVCDCTDDALAEYEAPLFNGAT